MRADNEGEFEEAVRRLSSRQSLSDRSRRGHTRGDPARAVAEQRVQQPLAHTKRREHHLARLGLADDVLGEEKFAQSLSLDDLQRFVAYEDEIIAESGIGC